MPRWSALALAVCLAARATAQEPEPRRESIVVTGTYEPIPLEEADRSVSSLPIEGRETLLNTFADLLRLDSSLDLRQRAPNSVQGDLSIRGSSFGQTLVLLDGLRLNDAQSGHHNLDVPVPLEAVERIEVLKGSGSTLYGSDAVGGVVNLITRRPEASEVRLRTAFGNWGVNQQRLSAGYTRSRWTQHVTASRDFSTGFMPNRDYRNLSLTSNTWFDTGLGSSEITLAHTDRPFGAEGFYGRFNSWERTKGWFASARQAFGSRTSASFAFRRHTDLFVLYRYRPQVYTNRHTVESFQGVVRRYEEIGGGRLHYGVEGYRDSIVSTNLGSHDRGRGAAYAAWDVRALRRFSFNLGLRDEVHASGNHEWSPSLSAGAWLGRGWKVRGGVSRAFRLPTYTDLYYHDPANQGSPDLRPERAWSYEAGLDWNAGGRFRASLTAFRREERDGIDYVRRSPADIWRATNFQRLAFTGVEAAVAVRLAAAQQLDFQYTGLRGAQDLLTGVQSKYTFNYPIHTGVASWQGTLGDFAVTRVRAGGVRRFGRDPYGVLDAYVARSRGRVRPFLQLSNLTDTAYEEIIGVPMPGRGLVGGVELLLFGAR